MGFKDFDESKDKCIKTFGIKKLDENTTLEIGIFQYNNGPKKLRAIRAQNGRNGNVYRKSIVNLDRQELELVKAIIEEASEELGA